MAEHRTRALVLRTFDQGESDRLVHLYTETLGRVSAIAKGARRSRRRFPGTLEIFSQLDVRLADPPRASLMRIDGAQLVHAPERLVEDLGRYAVACQILELLDRFTGEREAHPDLFRFAVGVLGVIEETQADRLLALLVLCKTLARLGYRPQLVRCASCGCELAASGPPVSFVPREGGALCPSCDAVEPGMDAPGPPPVSGGSRVSPALLARIEAGIRTPLHARGELGLAPDAVRRAETLMDRFFHFHVGFELRTTAFLRRTVRFDQVFLDDGGDRGDNARAPAAERGASCSRAVQIESASAPDRRP